MPTYKVALTVTAIDVRQVTADNPAEAAIAAVTGQIDSAKINSNTIFSKIEDSQYSATEVADDVGVYDQSGERTDIRLPIALVETLRADGELSVSEENVRAVSRESRLSD